MVLSVRVGFEPFLIMRLIVFWLFQFRDLVCRIDGVGISLIVVCILSALFMALLIRWLDGLGMLLVLQTILIARLL